MKRIYAVLLLSIFTAMTTFTIRVQLAYADTGSAAIAAAGSASSGSAAASATIHNPVDDPTHAIADVGQWWKNVGWPAGVLVATFLLLEVAQWIGGKFGALAFLDRGRTKVILAGGVAVTASMIDALGRGGGFGVVLGAGVVAIAAIWHPAGVKAPAPASASSPS